MNVKHLLMGVLLMGATTHAAWAGDIHVSATHGNDNADGTAATPLRTVHRALKMAREWRRLDDARVQGGINIMLEEGVYRMDKPLYVRPEDSGTPESPTVICCRQGGVAVMSGALPVTGWQLADNSRLPSRAKGKVWVAEAPRTGNRMVELRQLWVNGRKAHRASLFGEGVMQRMSNFDTADQSITIPTPDINLDNARQLEMVVHQRWAIAILRVKEMKRTEGGMTKVWFHEPESELEFAHPWPQPVIGGERGNSSFALVNAIEMLDEPGEWFQDYPSGKIYYYPLVGERMDRAEVMAPALTQLVEMAGTRERTVGHIVFDNIGFEHAAWTRPLHEGLVTLQGGFRFIDGYKLQVPGLFHKAALENQAWVARPDAAVGVQFAHDIAFRHCRFEHLGATALDLRYAVSRAEVAHCRFDDVGGTALLAGYFGEEGFETHIPYRPQVEGDLCSQLTIADNSIHDATNEDWGCVAIGAGYVSDTEIARNVVSHVNYSGICVGWGWTPLESGMRNNRIVDNQVHDYARQLYDAGGIYTLSNQPGSVISGNTIADPYPAPYATNHRAFCIYFDEATDGYTVGGNHMTKGSYGYNQPGKNLRVND